MATTIGVAVAVPDPWGKQLQDYRAGLGDASAAGIPTHITLMPPFEAEPDELPLIEEHLAEAAEHNPSFTIHLRGTGTFRPLSPVVFVVVVEGISACEQLAFSIRRGPLAAELQFPYHPHVTIAQDLDEGCLDKAFDELASFECRFTVDQFSLYVHEHPAGWRPTRGFALVADPEPSQVRVPPRSG